MSIQKHNLYIDEANSATYYYTSEGVKQPIQIEGKTYSAGTGISIENDIISTTGPIIEGDNAYITATSALENNNVVWHLSGTSAHTLSSDTKIYGENGISAVSAENSKWYVSIDNEYLEKINSVSSKLDTTVFEDFTSTADVSAYSAGNNINIENHIISSKDWSEDITLASSAAVDKVSANFNVENSKITGYNNIPIANDGTTYEGASGIIIEDNTIGISAKYLSADALDAVSSTWNEVSAKLDNNALDNLSGKWEDTSNTVTAQSAYWNDVSAYSATSSQFMVLTALKGENTITGYGESAFAETIYTGDDGIKVENKIISISADYLSGTALNDISANWEEAYNTLESTSAAWNAHSALSAAKLDSSESANYMLSAYIQGTNNIITGYNGSAFGSQGNTYEGINGIEVNTSDPDHYTIGISAQYLSANALNTLSANWQDTYTDVTAHSANWNNKQEALTNEQLSAISSVSGLSNTYITNEGENNIIDVTSAIDENGNITYNISAIGSSTGSNITITGIDGISVTESTPNNYVIGISADYLVSSALDTISGNWQDTYALATANSAIWNEYSATKQDTLTNEQLSAISSVSSIAEDAYNLVISGNAGAYVTEVTTGVFEVGISADYLDTTALNSISANWQYTYDTVTTNSAGWNEVSAKLDTTAFSNVSADFATEEWVTAQGYLTQTSANEYYQAKGDYLTADALDSVSSTWNEVSAKLGNTALDGLSGKWEDTSNTVSEQSAYWNNVSSYSATSSQFMVLTALKGENTITGYGESAFAETIYTGDDGIKVENKIISISADYLSGTALNDSSGKWEEAYNTIDSTSAAWNAQSALSAAKLDVTESANYMLTAYIQGSPGVITGYNGSAIGSQGNTYEGINGIEINTSDPDNYTIGISAQYLSATALNSLSANWQDTYTDVNAHSADWNNVSAKLDTTAFSTTSADFALSADVYNKTEIHELFANFGGYIPCEGTGADNHPDVQDPDKKIMYLVPKDDATDPDRYYNWIVSGTDPNTGWLCIGDTSINLTPYLTRAELSSISGNWNDAYNTVNANSANWNDTRTTVNSNSGYWDESYAALTSTSAIWNTSNDWTTANSANIIEASGAIQTVSATFTANSGYWDESYAALTSTSATWNDKQDELAFKYTTANEISAINSSAISIPMSSVINSAGIVDIVYVSAKPANPVYNVLYLVSAAG